MTIDKRQVIMDTICDMLMSLSCILMFDSQIEILLIDRISNIEYYRRYFVSYVVSSIRRDKICYDH